jgi:hypothetical protein
VDGCGPVVTLSSLMHRIGRIHLDDLDTEHLRHERWTVSGQAKLANLMFAYELPRPVGSRAPRTTVTCSGSSGSARRSSPACASTWPGQRPREVWCRVFDYSQ